MNEKDFSTKEAYLAYLLSKAFLDGYNYAKLLIIWYQGMITSSDVYRRVIDSVSPTSWRDDIDQLDAFKNGMRQAFKERGIDMPRTPRNNTQSTVSEQEKQAMRNQARGTQQYTPASDAGLDDMEQDRLKGRRARRESHRTATKPSSTNVWLNNVEMTGYLGSSFKDKEYAFDVYENGKARLNGQLSTRMLNGEYMRLGLSLFENEDNQELFTMCEDMPAKTCVDVFGRLSCYQNKKGETVYTITVTSLNKHVFNDDLQELDLDDHPF